MSDIAVDLINVTKRFGRDILAVDELTLHIAQGEYISFIGPSGCGKTTTLRMISGFEEPTEGQILIAGRDCTHLEPHERNTAMVFQHFALFPHMSVAQNVEFGLRMRNVSSGERAQRALEMLRAVDIEDLADRAIQQLSGGQQQRVGLARALVTRPDVLLLDEPLGSLDANLRLRMQRELRRLNTDFGVAFVHVTHTQTEAFAVSDRVVIMNMGRIEQIGPPEDVTHRPKNLFVAQFVGKNNILAGEITGVENGVATVTGPAGTFRARISGRRAGAQGLPRGGAGEPDQPAAQRRDAGEHGRGRGVVLHLRDLANRVQRRPAERRFDPCRRARAAAGDYRARPRRQGEGGLEHRRCAGGVRVSARTTPPRGRRQP